MLLSIKISSIWQQHHFLMPTGPVSTHQKNEKNIYQYGFGMLWESRHFLQLQNASCETTQPNTALASISMTILYDIICVEPIYVISWPQTTNFRPSIHAKTAVLVALLQLKLGEGKGSTNEDLKLLPHFRRELCHETCLDMYGLMDWWIKCVCVFGVRFWFDLLLFFADSCPPRKKIRNPTDLARRKTKWLRECWWPWQT